MKAIIKIVHFVWTCIDSFWNVFEFLEFWCQISCSCYL